MQENIYHILSKHFFNQTTDEEERLIETYKAGHLDEYLTLRKLFKDQEVSVVEFDSKKAWQKTIDKYTSRRAPATKVVPLYRQFSRMVAAAVILFGVIIGAYFYFGKEVVPDGKMLLAKGDVQDRIVLSDSTVIWLNENAEISYPDHFSDVTRTVQLRGEAFFEVTKNPDKPFVVRTENASIRVLGTSFNVNSETESTQVTVNTGIVQVQSNFSSRAVTISKGYTANASGEDVISHKTSNENYNSWKTGVFNFDQAPLSSVVKDLNSFYNSKIRLSPDLAINCELTARFDNAPLKDIIDVLVFTCNISIQKDGDGYTITR